MTTPPRQILAYLDYKKALTTSTIDTVLISICTLCGVGNLRAESFDGSIKSLLKQYCVNCHGGEETNADVNFLQIRTQADVQRHFQLWEQTVQLVNDSVMPPADEPQPTAEEKAKLNAWYRQLVESVQPHPGFFRPRRLSAHEYRNTLQSLLGFELDVAVREAEQTVVEKSLVMKLLPTDPPGPSGFKNDTSANPLTTVIWDQYSYLVDNGLERLFSPTHRDVLQAHVGKLDGEHLSAEQAERLLRTMVRRAYRRNVDDEMLAMSLAAIDGKTAEELATGGPRRVEANSDVAPVHLSRSADEGSA